MVSIGGAAVPLAALLLLMVAGCTAAQGGGSDLGFDYLVLARQWGPTFCESRNCDQPTFNQFTIHGLWPNNLDGDHPAACDPADRFDRELLTQEQLGRMSCEWRSFRGSNAGFWSYQWDKHGTCGKALMPNETAYFGTALALSEKYDINEALVRAGINPLAATGVTQAQLLGVLEGEWGVTPQVTCFQGAVMEVRLCVDTSLRPMDCPSGGSCSSRNTLALPYGGEIPPICQQYLNGVPDANNIAAPSTGGDRSPPPSPGSGAGGSRHPGATGVAPAVVLLLATAVAALAVLC